MSSLSVVIDEKNVPEPPTWLVEWLRSFDPSFRIRVYRHYPTWSWTVCQRWPESDPRWARVQSQEVSPDDAFDIVAWLPPAIALDDVPGYLERGMVAVGRSAEYIGECLARVRAKNQQTKDDAWRGVERQLMEAAQAVSNVANHADGAVVAELGTRVYVTAEVK